MLAICALLVATALQSSAADLSGLSSSARNLFNTALSYSDTLFDPTSSFSLTQDGQYDTRSSAMYATGLLLRNQGEDVKHATRIIEVVAESQYGPDTQGQPWFGTYPDAPDQPTPGSNNGTLYGTLIYNDWDPNWRDFIGTAWCLALATSDHLLPKNTVKTLENSLLLAAEGAALRFQGRGEYANSVDVDATQDNLDEAYTNPWLMGTFLMGYIGNRLKNTTLIQRSETDAQKIYDLFTYKGFNTFSEYNSPTYTGVDLYALALWVKYAPQGSKMRKLGPFMLSHAMSDIAALYHADLRNIAGPWDRTYGFDMTRYHSVAGQIITALAPENKGAIPFSLTGSLHVGDYPLFAGLNAFLSPVFAAATPRSALDNFASFKGERTISRKLRTNTEDPTAVRNVTAWLGTGMTIGAQSLDEPSPRQSSMVPAVLQWILPPSKTNVHTGSLPRRLGYIALSPPTAGVINATASPHTLSISLPPSQKFTNLSMPQTLVLAVGGFEARAFSVDMTRGLAGLPGLKAKIETNGLGNFQVAYNGSESYNGFFSYYITYPVNVTWPDVPSLTITVEQ